MARRIADEKKSFIQKLIREWRSLPRPPQKILVAVSGGVDSMALLLALSEIQKLFSLDLTVAHVHHGLTSSAKTNGFRDYSQQVVKEQAQCLQLSFVTNTPQLEKASSEADLRKFRYQQLTSWQEKLGAEVIALAHRQEDLLETQIMRMMRGVGSLGLGSLTLLSPQGRLRPFLHFKKDEMVQFVKNAGVSWAEDPSNRSMRPFRNRIRQWLGQMEEISPGSQENLLKSLSRVVRLTQEIRNPWKEEFLTKGSIKRSDFLSLSAPFKIELLAHYLRLNGIESYTSGQLEELMKRLDVSKKNNTFNFFGRHWTLTPETIEVESNH